MRRIALILALPALLLGAPVALAHAFLDRAVPAVGSTVHQPPTEVRLCFTEAIEVALSSARVEDAAGHTVSTGPAKPDASDRQVLVVPMGTLPPGSYKVIWRVLSVDTHVTTGDFRFTVAP
ncbi:MAG TPA: copper resistance protein CopC [Stellaceae bacterium]|nr:copper resistance protein CopC [Stellaceae bacterium]